MGAKSATFRLKPDLAIVIDVTHGEGPGTGKWEAYPVNKVTIAHGPNIQPKLEKIAVEAAKENGVDTVMEVCTGVTATDACETQTAAGGRAVAASVHTAQIHAHLRGAFEAGHRAGNGRLIALVIEKIAREWEGFFMVLKELCLLRGVSGDEGRVRDFIQSHIKAHADRIWTDPIGNLMAYKKGTEGKKHVLLAAHMDEVGFMVLGINDNGLLSYEPVGGIDARVVVSKPVLVGEKEVPGVIGAKAIHLQTRAEFEKVLKHEDLYIDIGASTKEEAEKLVSVGDYVSFRSDWREFARALSRQRRSTTGVGCMTLMSLLENDYPCDITCAFTVQEEIGLRGAACVGHNVQADEAIVLEGTPPTIWATCLPTCASAAWARAWPSPLWTGPAFPAAPCGRSCATRRRKRGIAWQFKQSVSGGNDAGAIQLSREGRAHGRTQRTLPQHPFRRQRGRLFRHRGAVPPCRQLSEEAVR